MKWQPLNTVLKTSGSLYCCLAHGALALHSRKAFVIVASKDTSLHPLSFPPLGGGSGLRCVSFWVSVFQRQTQLGSNVEKSVPPRRFHRFNFVYTDFLLIFCLILEMLYSESEATELQAPVPFVCTARHQLYSVV
jgi:hypothetical protein